MNVVIKKERKKLKKREKELMRLRCERKKERKN